MVGLPPLKKILTCIFIICILMPLIYIIRKNNLVQKIMDALDDFFQKTNEEAVTQKKNGLFS